MILQLWFQATAAMFRSAFFWDITRRRVVIYRRFGTIYRSHLYGSRVRVGLCFQLRLKHHFRLGSVDFLDCLTLKMKALISFETPATTRSKTRCHIPEDFRNPAYLMLDLHMRLGATRTDRVWAVSGTWFGCDTHGQSLSCLWNVTCLRFWLNLYYWAAIVIMS